MVVVDAVLAVVQPRRRLPFDLPAVVDGGGVTAIGVDQPIVGPTRQGHLIDVGMPAGSPVGLSVVGLTAVGAHRAAGFGAPPVTGDEHDALGRAGDTAGPEIVQGRTGGLIEDRQVVTGVGAHADDVADRDLGAPAAHPDPGARFEVLQGRADDHRHR